MEREELIAKACETINDVARNAIAELEKSCMNGTFSMDFSEMENVSGYTAPKMLAIHLMEREIDKMRVTDKCYDHKFVLWCRRLSRSIKL